MTERRLLQVSSGHVYVWTDTLSKKKDMVEIPMSKALNIQSGALKIKIKPPEPRPVDIVSADEAFSKIPPAVITTVPENNPIIDEIVADASILLPEETPSILADTIAAGPDHDAEISADIDVILNARTKNALESIMVKYTVELDREKTLADLKKTCIRIVREQAIKTKEAEHASSTEG